MIHRHCQTRIDTLEAEVRAADRRATDALAETARQRADAESASTARWDAAGDVEQLRDRLSAANKRVWELECTVNDLTETDSPIAAARERRTRAAWLTLWRSPWAVGVDHARPEPRAQRAAIAQTILAMPLEVFTGQLTRRGGTYYLGDTPALLVGMGERVVPEEELRYRYGVTDTEITAAMTADRDAA